MVKRKAGLHKEISSIFEGVRIPKENGAQQPPHTPVPGRTRYVPPKPLAPSSPTPPTPEPQQPVPSPPKTVPLERPKKTDISTKAWGQMKDKLFASKLGVSTTRQKAMAILVPVLFVVLIFVLINVFSIPSPKTTKLPSFRPTGVVAPSNNEIDWQIPELYPATLRDPMQMQFVSEPAPKVETTKLIVKGILYSEDDPTAVIGTQVVHEGEKILDVTIVKINKDNVEFEMDGKRWTQEVQP